MNVTTIVIERNCIVREGESSLIAEGYGIGIAMVRARILQPYKLYRVSDYIFFLADDKFYTTLLKGY